MEDLLLEDRIKKLQDEVFLLKNENELLKLTKTLKVEKSNDYFHFKTMFDHLQIPILILKDFMGSRIEYSNQAWSDCSGYSVESLPYLKPHAIVHPDYKHLILENGKKRVSGDYKDYSYEIKIMTKSLGVKSMIFTTNVIVYKGKLRTMVVAKDLSIERPETRELVKAKQTCETIFNASLIKNIIIDVNSQKIINANQAAVDFLQYSKKELLEKRIDDVIVQLPAHVSNFRSLYKKEGVVEDIKFEIKNKEIRDVEASISYIKIDGEDVCICFLRDVTQRKAIEKALVESETKYKAIVDSNYDGIYIYRNNKVLFANKRIFSMSGYSPKEFAAFDFWDIIHPEDRERIRKFAKDRASGVSTLDNYQGRVVCKGGDIKECEFSVTVIKYLGDYAVLGVVRDISYRVRSEKVLRENERFLTTLLSNLNGVVYRCTADGNYTMHYLSDAIYSLSGYPKEDILLSSKIRFTDMIHPDDKAYVNSRVWEDDSFSLEYRIICKDESVKWIWEQGVKIIDEQKAVCIEGIISDITSFKNAQSKLKFSERKFRNLFNNIQSIVAIVDETGRLIDFNPITAVLLKRNAEELKNSSIAELGLVNDEYLLKSIIKDNSDSSKVIFGSRVELLDESIVDFDVQLSSIDHGGKLHILLVAQDVTERVRLDKAMKESAALYKAIFGNTGTATCITSSTGDILLVNKKFEELCECNGPELLGEKNIVDFVPSLKFDQEKDGSKIQLLEINLGEFVFRDIVGGEKTVVSMVQNIEESNDFVISLLDVSKRKQAEFELKKLNEELEERVQKRTKQLSIANNSKSEFLANISHEIRTPLNAILGFSELLSKKLENVDYKRYLHSIQVSGNNLLSLINDTLDLSKIEAGKLDIKTEPIRISSILKEIETIFKFKSESKGVDFSISIKNNIGESNLFFVLDGNRLRQVLVNLVNNGIKFTSKGYVKLLLEINKTVIKDCAELVLCVEDSGIGISKGFLDRIFDPFTQEDASFDSNQSGTGLGLSISKKLIELMNGELLVESKVGDGSRFKIILKEVAIDSRKIVSSNDEVLADNVESVKFVESTVLIVDDVLLNREYLIDLLKDFNLNVLDAKSGDEAIALLTKNKVDVIITDLKMPGKDGFLLLNDIRKLHSFTNTPIIAATAMSNDSVLVKIQEAGFDSYILKPYSISAVIVQLIKFLPYIKKERKEKVEKREYQIPKLKLLVVKQIEDDVIPLYNLIKERQAQAEVMLFGNSLIDIGEKFQEKVLIDFGKDVLVCMQGFDISRLMERLDWFGGLLDVNDIKYAY